MVIFVNECSMNMLNNLAYRIIVTAFNILGLLPRKWSVTLGNGIGYIWFRIHKKRRKVTIDNLTLAYGHEMKSCEIDALALRVFQNLSQIIFEIGWTLRQDKKDYSRYFSIKGLSHFIHAHKKKKGVLLLTAHLGNWELLSILTAMTPYAISMTYRPLDFSPFNRFIVEFRTRFGGELIPKDKAMRKLFRSLKQGEAIGMLMDQSVDWYKGVFVDFFGRMTSTNKGLALLALKTESPIVPIFIVRDGLKFRIEFGQELPLIKTGDKTKDVEENTRQYNRVIENMIRKYPEQWLWVHRRWKVKPQLR